GDDADQRLFSSDQFKTGRSAPDGSTFELIEFDGQPAVGTPSNPKIRTESTAVAVGLHSLRIVKIVADIDSGYDILWIVFKETASSEERRVVQ
ncbi:MAG: hypothetical protein LBE56_10205, partial [Tannerella sp.]|nr:hypothetical protein [Tannerella sp.]